MKPSPSPDRYSFDKRIQDSQGDIDRLDSRLDSKIDIAGLQQEQKDAMKQAYIDKVNTLQGQVRRSFEKIDIQRDLRSAEWRKWEDEVLGVETDLFVLLSDEYEKLRSQDEESIAIVSLADFNLKIDELLNEVSALDKKYEEPVQTAESNEEEPLVPRSVEEIFHEWDVPESAEKAKQAIEHYGEKQIRDLAAALTLFESLPSPVMESLFKTTTPVLRQQIAGQLANGTFESSPLAFLLTEDFNKIEESVLADRELVLDRVNTLSQEVRDLEERTHKQIAQLCKTAKEDVADDTIGNIVAWAMNANGYPEIQEQIIRSVRGLADEVQSRQNEINELAVQLKQVEYAFNSFDTTKARNEGRKAQEAQLLFRTKIDFGQDVRLPDSQLQLLRPAQQQLLLGRHNDALRTSIDSFNSFVEQNPDLDTLDRVDLLQLSSASRAKPDGARFESVDVMPRDPFARFDVRNAGFSRLRPSLGPDSFLTQQPQKITVLRELGQLKEGGELILVELPRMEGGGGETAVALRDSEGVVHLQDGTVLEDPRELRPMKINSSAAYGRTVYVSPETESYLRSNVNSQLSSRVILRDGIRETKPIAPFATGPIYTLDKSQLQLASRNDKGGIILWNTNGNLEQTLDAGRLRKESTEQGQDVLRSIDQNPLIQDITQRAGTLQENMQNMQMMLQTAMSGEANVGDAFIGQLRNYARPMLGVLEDQTTKQQVLQAKELLQSELQRVKYGKFLGRGMESEIQSRIDALDDYIDVLDDNRMLHGLQTAMEVRPDTWESWLGKEGLIMLGAIVAAVIAIGLLTVFTGGAGLIAISAVGAAAGIAGAEGTKELLYQYHNTRGGATTGQYRYTDGSRVGNYFREQKLFDPQTGEFIEMGFLKDVALPYAQEFLVAFGTTALALGAGQAAGNVLSRLAQNSKAIQALAKNSGIANSIMKRLSGLSDDTAKIPSNMRELAKRSFKEILDELNDELVLEAGVAQGLMRIDKRLAFLATFIVATGKGFKPLAGGQLAYESDMSTADVRAWAEEQGHTVASENNGVFDVKTFDGQTLILKPVAEAEIEQGNLQKNPSEKQPYEMTREEFGKYIVFHGTSNKAAQKIRNSLNHPKIQENPKYKNKGYEGRTISNQQLGSGSDFTYNAVTASVYAHSRARYQDNDSNAGVVFYTRRDDVSLPPKNTYADSSEVTLSEGNPNTKAKGVRVLGSVPASLFDGLNQNNPIDVEIAYERAYQYVLNQNRKKEAGKENAENDSITARVSNVSDAELQEVIQKINDEHHAGIEESRFSVIRNTPEGVVTVNKAGKLELVAINQGNAIDVLKRVKEETDFNAEHSGYELRQECLRRNPDIPTHIAYTYGDVPKVKSEMKAYIADPVNWIPEKRQFHEQLFTSTMDKVRENSKRMRPESIGAEKVVVMLRGNTAAGKSSSLRNAKAPRLQELNASPDGAINPDDMKSYIRSQEKAGEKHTVSHDQAHSEGSMMAEKVIDQAFNEELNMVVIDKRFASTDDVAEVTGLARQKGYKVVMVDVDAELETSISRVHGGVARGRKYPGRSPDGDDPVVPFNRIEGGYNDVVQDRRKVMQLVNEYYLYKTDVIGSGETVLIAEHQDGSVTIHNPKIFEHVTRDVKRENQFVRHSMDNLRKTSRTSQGTVDTSATKLKAESIAVSGKEAAYKANTNYENVMRELYRERTRTFNSPFEVREFVEQVARDVNQGILKDGILMRRADSEKFPYTRLSDLPQATNEFYQKFFNRLNDPQQDPIELAAWLEFNVDLTRHFFEDGCGKVAKALSAWALARRGMPPPIYNDRGEYYAHAPKRSPTDNATLRQKQLNEWVSYYRSLNNGKPE